MREGWLWRCGAVILVHDKGISSSKKSLRAFEVGRLERMASEIIDIILKSKEVFSKGIVDNIFP